MSKIVPLANGGLAVLNKKTSKKQHFIGKNPEILAAEHGPT